ncbi:hypothetical protein [Exiguobacterium sp.]|uniref:hypothetical protein n=1 Tax=Exiguobacterium sp. TaxID=44751 RepID=UPI0028ADC0A1|nr:hypothetical protein [Exiguobacterium sp.]
MSGERSSISQGHSTNVTSNAQNNVMDEAIDTNDLLNQLDEVVSENETKDGASKKIFMNVTASSGEKAQSSGQHNNLSSTNRVSVKVSEEIVLSASEIGLSIDDHLKKFLIQVLKEFQIKTLDRKTWSNRIWRFTLALITFTFILIVANYFAENMFFKKSLIDEKLLYVFVGGMFAQIITLMLVVMKHVFSPSKDVYSYLTELVKVRKLKDDHLGEGEPTEMNINQNGE